MNYESARKDKAFDVPEARLRDLLLEHGIDFDQATHRDVHSWRKSGDEEEKHVFDLYVKFPQKGNKDLIDNLEAEGYKKMLRYKDTSKGRNEPFQYFVKYALTVKTVLGDYTSHLFREMTYELDREEHARRTLSLAELNLVRMREQIAQDIEKIRGKSPKIDVREHLAPKPHMVTEMGLGTLREHITGLAPATIIHDDIDIMDSARYVVGVGMANSPDRTLYVAKKFAAYEGAGRPVFGMDYLDALLNDAETPETRKERKKREKQDMRSFVSNGGGKKKRWN